MIAFSQTDNNNPSDTKSLMVGLKVGLIVSNIYGSEAEQFKSIGINYTARKSWTLGIDLKKPISKNVYFKSGVNYANVGTDFGNENDEFKVSLFRLPLLLGISPGKENSNFSLEFGLSFNKMSSSSISGPVGDRASWTKSLLTGFVIRQELEDGNWVYFNFRYFHDISPYFTPHSFVSGVNIDRELNFRGLSLTIGLMLNPQ